MINPIKAFETSDGTILKDREEAIRYEDELEFDLHLEENRLYSQMGSSVSAEDLKCWLLDNKEAIINFIGV